MNIKKLMKNNEQFCRNNKDDTSLLRKLCQEGPRPKLIVITCSDARIDVEKMTGANLGDIFVIRNGGHVINDYVIGSSEFAIKTFKSEQILILGHTGCGALLSAIEFCNDINIASTPYLKNLLTKISMSFTKKSLNSKEKKEINCLQDHIKSCYDTLLHSDFIKDCHEKNLVQIFTGILDTNSGHITIDDD